MSDNKKKKDRRSNRFYSGRKKYAPEGVKPLRGQDDAGETDTGEAETAAPAANAANPASGRGDNVRRFRNLPPKAPMPGTEQKKAPSQKQDTLRNGGGTGPKETQNEGQRENTKDRKKYSQDDRGNSHDRENGTRQDFRNQKDGKRRDRRNFDRDRKKPAEESEEYKADESALTGESFFDDADTGFFRKDEDLSPFGYRVDTEKDDRLIDSMPPDPTLDDVFALPADLAARNTAPESGTEIVGIRFPQSGKLYYFSPGGIKFEQGDFAIVETARGAEMGEVGLPNRLVPEDRIVQPLKTVIRKASEADMAHEKENRSREKDCEKICLEKIAARGLDMKLVGAQYTFDNAKLIFYFTAAQRVDFRELVKDLAAAFHTRIELRQIGIRDEAKMLGGNGLCGRPICCASFLPGYAQATIKMAKEQGLALTSSKISGLCGRLMCCLKFEQQAYDEELASLPTVESVVETPDGQGTVTELRPMSRLVRVRLTGREEAPKLYRADDIRILKLAAGEDGEAESNAKANANGDGQGDAFGSEKAFREDAADAGRPGTEPPRNGN